MHRRFSTTGESHRKALVAIVERPPVGLESDADRVNRDLAHRFDHERALFNGVLGTQHSEDGPKLYYVPLASGYWKLFGNPLHDFWCCTGTGSESFAKLGDSIYLHDGARSSSAPWGRRGT